MAKSKLELMKEKMERERVGETAYEAGKKPAIETTIEPEETKQPEVKEVAPEKPVEQKKPEKKAKEGKTPTKEPAIAKEKTVDLLAGVGKKKVEKKAFTYYLSVENNEKLKRASKAKNVSASELLDYIISNIDM